MGNKIHSIYWRRVLPCLTKCGSLLRRMRDKNISNKPTLIYRYGKETGSREYGNSTAKLLYLLEPVSYYFSYVTAKYFILEETHLYYFLSCGVKFKEYLQYT